MQNEKPVDVVPILRKMVQELPVLSAEGIAVGFAANEIELLRGLETIAWGIIRLSDGVCIGASCDRAEADEICKYKADISGHACEVVSLCRSPNKWWEAAK